jgi:hypothetical protein
VTREFRRVEIARSLIVGEGRTPLPSHTQIGLVCAEPQPVADVGEDYMGINPFITKKEWQEEKKKYGIPDNIIKGGKFGDKMDALQKRFDAERLKFVTAPKVPAALALVKDANKLFDEWLAGAEKLKPEAFKASKVTKDPKQAKTKAIDRLKWYKSLIKNMENEAKEAKDPFISVRMNYDKCLAAMKKAMAHPDDASAIQTLYSQGIRNWIGAPFHTAVTTYRGEPEVVKLLNDYEKIAAKWNSLQGSNGPSTLAADPVKRKVFLKDMEDAMKICVRILGVTQPKG